MKKRIFIICLLLATAVSINAQEKEFPKLTGPYLGQKPPGMEKVILACSMNWEEKRISDKEPWNEDLEYVVHILKTRHPNLYYHLNQEEFENSIAQLKRDIPHLSDAEAVIRFMQLVAKIQDGHTWLYPYGVPFFDVWFPIRFTQFSDGLYISAVDEEYKTILGCKVLKIGEMVAEKAFNIAGTIAFADNIFGRAYSTPLFLSNAQAIKTLGIISSIESLPLEIEFHNGEKSKVNLKSLKTQFDGFWLMRPDTGPPGGKYVSVFTGKDNELPRHLKNRSKYFWYKYIVVCLCIFFWVSY